jgi:hypothetical protein
MFVPMKRRALIAGLILVCAVIDSGEASGQVADRPVWLVVPQTFPEARSPGGPGGPATAVVQSSRYGDMIVLHPRHATAAALDFAAMTVNAMREAGLLEAPYRRFVVEVPPAHTVARTEAPLRVLQRLRDAPVDSVPGWGRARAILLPGTQVIRR